jgi:hypothetical protein
VLCCLNHRSPVETNTFKLDAADWGLATRGESWKSDRAPRLAADGIGNRVKSVARAPFMTTVINSREVACNTIALGTLATLEFMLLPKSRSTVAPAECGDRPDSTGVNSRLFNASVETPKISSRNIDDVVLVKSASVDDLSPAALPALVPRYGVFHSFQSAKLWRTSKVKE